jgi:hypothetical protein
MISGEALLRIEHKLDALLLYMRGMTGMPPAQMPKPILGMGGLTGSKCPITDTDIYVIIDPITGKASRKDGLSTGIIETSVFPEQPTFASKSVILGKSTMSEGNDD